MEQLFSTDSLIAASAIVLHVAHYNASAHVEHATRIYTKVLGRNAVYFYAVLLIVCALVRDHFIYIALQADEASVWCAASKLWEIVPVMMMHAR